MRAEIASGPSNTSGMQREMTPEPSDPSVKPPQGLAAASLETQGNSGVPRSKSGIPIYWFAIPVNSIVSSTIKRNPPLLLLLPTGFKFHHWHHRPRSCPGDDPRLVPRLSPVWDDASHLHSGTT